MLDVSNSTFEVTISILTATVAMLVLSIYPGLQYSINRGKQKRTMAHMRTIGTAIESYHLDFNFYPSGKSTIQDIQNDLQGYLEEVPLEDEWGNQYFYRSDGLTSYTIISLGKDQLLDGSSFYKGLVTDFSNDIVFSDGVFTCFPSGGC